MFLVSRITLSMLLSPHAFYYFSITDHEELTPRSRFTQNRAQDELSYFVSQWVRCLALSTGLYRLYRDTLVKVILKLLLAMNWADWRKAFCCSWSRGRHLSPSVPGDRYLKLAHKRAHRAEITEDIVSYGALAPRPEMLLSWYLVWACAFSVIPILYGNQISA